MPGIAAHLYPDASSRSTSACSDSPTPRRSLEALSSQKRRRRHPPGSRERPHIISGGDNPRASRLGPSPSQGCRMQRRRKAPFWQSGQRSAIDAAVGSPEGVLSPESLQIDNFFVLKTYSYIRIILRTGKTPRAFRDRGSTNNLGSLKTPGR